MSIMSTKGEVHTEDDTTNVLGSLLHDSWGNATYAPDGQVTWQVGLIDLTTEREIMAHVIGAEGDTEMLPEAGWWVVWVSEDERENALRYETEVEARRAYSARTCHTPECWCSGGGE